MIPMNFFSFIVLVSHSFFVWFWWDHGAGLSCLYWAGKFSGSYCFVLTTERFLSIRLRVLSFPLWFDLGSRNSKGITTLRGTALKSPWLCMFSDKTKRKEKKGKERNSNKYFVVRNRKQYTNKKGSKRLQSTKVMTVTSHSEPWPKGESGIPQCCNNCCRTGCRKEIIRRNSQPEEFEKIIQTSPGIPPGPSAELSWRY